MTDIATPLPVESPADVPVTDPQPPMTPEESSTIPETPATEPVTGTTIATTATPLPENSMNGMEALKDEDTTMQDAPTTDHSPFPHPSENGISETIVSSAVVPVSEPAPAVTPVSPGVQIVLPLEEFAEDLDLRLGRANGNIYKRRPGVEGIHDGQVMVRLKKKRFIVIDYSIVPNEHDLQAAAISPHINVPLGAGVTKCTGKVASEPGGPLVPCKKIGMPILLYDSEPDQPPSLYLRSGLCFICQRNLNEKRRTQRKRPSDRANHQAAAKVTAHAQQSQAAFLAAQHAGVAMGGPLPALGSTTNLPGMQHVRIGGIGAQASLVGAGTTGRVNATPHHRVLMAVTNGHKKIKLAHTNQPLILAPDAIILNGPPDNHSCKSVRGGNGFADIGTDLNVEVHQSLQSTQALLHSVNTPGIIQQGIPPPTPDEICQTYDQAFYSLSKSLYLLVQWKTSWDAAIASAMQQEAHSAVMTVPQQHRQHPPSQAEAATAAASLAVQQQNAAALQAASMANAAATAAIGGMINGVPGSVPVGITGLPVSATPTGMPTGMPPMAGVEQDTPPVTLAQAVASAAAVAAVQQAPAEASDVVAVKQETVSQAPPLDQSVEV